MIVNLTGQDLEAGVAHVVLDPHKSGAHLVTELPDLDKEVGRPVLLLGDAVVAVVLEQVTDEALADWVVPHHDRLAGNAQLEQEELAVSVLAEEGVACTRALGLLQDLLGHLQLARLARLLLRNLALRNLAAGGFPRRNDRILG